MRPYLGSHVTIAGFQNQVNNESRNPQLKCPLTHTQPDFTTYRLELQELESFNKGLEEEKENIKSRLMRTKSTAESKLVFQVGCLFVMWTIKVSAIVMDIIINQIQEMLSRFWHLLLR